MSDGPTICSCGVHAVSGGNLYCDMCLADEWWSNMEEAQERKADALIEQEDA